MVFIVHKNYFCLALNFGFVLLIIYILPLLLTNFELRSLFSFSILVGQCFILYGLIGNISLVKYLCLFLILIMPFMYYKKLLPFLPLTIIGFANTISAYFLFEQIIIFLQFFSIALTVVFFNKLIQTENQFYHGLTTLFASSGIVFLYLAIELSSNG